ncbi:hypothetical protein RchiOBHm_Chr7g0205541 [Rosa chinensis]|uniref:Uncharacterized protein n=1 Tax=Rosa chinensis TaxID=74649 RepID=A0A2P6P8Y0_ROSCH|nr:hypothetical protein RchiOBHm_Chr7g0205541 [Rosa chinensis]
MVIFGIKIETYQGRFPKPETHPPILFLSPRLSLPLSADSLPLRVLPLPAASGRNPANPKLDFLPRSRLWKHLWTIWPEKLGSNEFPPRLQFWILADSRPFRPPPATRVLEASGLSFTGLIRPLRGREKSPYEGNTERRQD